ncbi:MAG TPA: HD domain-containing protein [Hyphomicrobiaceae bacterium]|nr:HD domain-containing protein [Hyphomicrobiaceae bacterium]
MSARGDVLLIVQALAFASEHHASQRRKGDAGEPYINHLAEVADLVGLATRGEDPHLVAAALLHDVVEDQGVSVDELQRLFGEEVAAVVGEVSDDKTLPKAERKRLQIELTPKKSERARLLKLADKTSNLRSMRVSPPSGWSLERRREYLAWARSVANGTRGLSPWLEQRFDEAAAALEATLNGTGERR